MGADDVIVRQATPRDFGAVAALTVEVYVGEGFVRAESPYAAELADTARRAADADVLVAEHEGVVIGSLTVAAPGTPFADVARPGELEFRMLAVAKRARGLGAGTALVRTVIDRAAAEGYEAVVLTTMLPMVDALRIYERMGFVAVPERDWATPMGAPLRVYRLDLGA